MIDKERWDKIQRWDDITLIDPVTGEQVTVAAVYKEGERLEVDLWAPGQEDKLLLVVAQENVLAVKFRPDLREFAKAVSDETPPDNSG